MLPVVEPLQAPNPLLPVRCILAAGFFAALVTAFAESVMGRRRNLADA